MEGFIRLHRKIVDWCWYTDPVTKAVFLDLLLLATYTPRQVKYEHLEPGQCIASYPLLAKRNRISIQQARTALEHLKSTGEVTVRVTARYSVVTLVNWASYQTEDERATGRATGKSLGNQQASNRLSNTKQENKKERNTIRAREDEIPDDGIVLPDDELDEALDAFKEFRRAGKKAMTPNAERLILDKLERMAPGDRKKQAGILNQSIVNGWTGIYPLKDAPGAEGEVKLNLYEERT